MNKKRAVYVILIVLLLYVAGVCFSYSAGLAVPVPLVRVPSFLKGIYEQDLYTTDIRTYGKCMTLAPYVYVNKSLRSWPEGRQMYLCYYEYPFLGYGEKRFEAFLKKLKPHESGVAGKEFQYARYRVTALSPKHLRQVRDYDLVVIRHKGRVLGRWTEPAVGKSNYGKPDVRRLPDGRYMAVNGHAVRYISEKRGKKVIESYFDTGAPYIGSFHVGPLYGMPKYTILSDNVIRLAYKDGSVEHRKVRLSREDFLKNAGIDEQALEDAGIRSYMAAGKRHVLWRSSVQKPDPPDRPRKMWCYREGGEEPSAGAYADISFAKTK